VERAAEPTDVFWENMTMKLKDRVKRSIWTYLATFLVLGVCFMINLAINIKKDSLEEEARLSNSTEALSTVRFLSLFASLVIVFINGILRLVIKFFSK
jgi:hypothetical protein